uniref:Uncharacterized protein n=1 Tax=Hemiselmis andersenii TaxID=464988 RepID=A0A7S1MWF4_HEMAN|mmetsp:Transcript_61398/g.147782  ORF Transcript_61398/g.147782 Transcript_61398/m.147782 type:complete len:143 (+) Transcript_61398:202-630(+)
MLKFKKKNFFFLFNPWFISEKKRVSKVIFLKRNFIKPFDSTMTLVSKLLKNKKNLIFSNCFSILKKTKFFSGLEQTHVINFRKKNLDPKYIHYLKDFNSGLSYFLHFFGEEEENFFFKKIDSQEILLKIKFYNECSVEIKFC